MEDYDCMSIYQEQSLFGYGYYPSLDDLCLASFVDLLDPSVVAACQQYSELSYVPMPTEEIFADDQFPLIPNFQNQNYQTLDVQDFNDFETWWNANLSLLLYDDSDINAASTTKPALLSAPELQDIQSCQHTNSSSGGGDGLGLRQVAVRKKRQSKKSSALEYEEIQKYFHVPITKAAKELRVGVTVLKKRCRELDIGRWPHRKIKSLNGLIHNVKELGVVTNEDELRMLEEHKRALEMVPGLELSARTKKLRQACFKANYKKKRLLLLP